MNIDDLGKDVVKDESYKLLDNKTIFLKDDQIGSLRGCRKDELLERIRTVRKV